MIQFLQEQSLWSILLMITVIIESGIFIYSNYSLPTTKQKQKVLEWLLYYVVEAERYFGGGTGQIKLRYVYDGFLDKFPKIAKVVSFDTFSEWVDVALDKMKVLIENNTEVKEYVEL